jgi:predicted homoserine dehydrogenase-like protein
MRITRRQFVTTAAVGVTALSARRVFGANARIGVALIGCGMRGTEVAAAMNRADNVEICVVCDVYGRNAEKARTRFGGQAKAITAKSGWISDQAAES